MKYRKAKAEVITLANRKNIDNSTNQSQLEVNCGKTTCASDVTTGYQWLEEKVARVH